VRKNSKPCRVLPSEYEEQDRGYDTPCWIWTAHRPTGVGYISIRREGRFVLAHRVAYEQYKGAIPDGLVLDHLCRVPACVNPDHLEAVTQRENALRGVGITAQLARQTHCKRGHSLSGENLHINPESLGERVLRLHREGYGVDADRVLDEMLERRREWEQPQP
jgi:hypothetical protein